MNDSTRPDARRRAIGAVIALAVLLAMVSMSCALGQALVGSRETAGAQPTKTLRPTFTPLPGALSLSTPGQGGIRGALAPGVTVPAPPTDASSVPISEPGAPNDTISLVIYATDTPIPTTPAEPTATPTVDLARSAPISQPQATPYAVVNNGALAGRRGPGEVYERVGQAAQGAELLLLGRSPDGAWWQVCCMANQPVWVPAGSIEVRGETAALPVVNPPAPPPPTAPPPPPPPRTPTPTPGLPFDIARGPEFPITRDDGILTIWVKAYAGPLDNQTPLGGYILKVFRDGVDVTDNKTTSDGPFDSTGPRQGDYLYNLKFEMYNGGEADWEIYLARPGGFRVSPISKFTTKGSSYRHLVVYIAYWLAR